MIRKIIKIDEEKVKEVSSSKITFVNPSWKNSDGTMAEW